MLPEIARLATTPDHVSAVTGADALLYIGAVVMWLGGVVALIIRKFRAA